MPDKKNKKRRKGNGLTAHGDAFDFNQPLGTANSGEGHEAGYAGKKFLQAGLDGRIVGKVT